MAGPSQEIVGIIGLGAMGKMYARRFSEAGWRVHACDREDQYDLMKQEFADQSNVHIFPNGYSVSESSDWIIYSVEAEAISKVVSLYGSSTKKGAVVGGQTSCKAPEIAALEQHLPSDIDIISCHSLHGPSVDPKGQPLAVINHRSAHAHNLALVLRVLSCLNSSIVSLTAVQHDRITADTQAVTHAAFLSMGTAWHANAQFPWRIPRYIGGIENIKINLTLRIYSNKWHVYAGLAILNPSAKEQIRQYAASVSELFKLMMHGDRRQLTDRVHAAAKAVFTEDRSERRLLLDDSVLDRFSLARSPERKTPNNHLSLLGMVDSWWKLGIVPYDHMICSTPLFRLWLGATEYLFRNPELLEESLNYAIDDTSFRSDDLEFVVAARGWSECVSLGLFEGYKARFEKIQSYFALEFPEATKVGNEMIKTIFEHTEPTK